MRVLVRQSGDMQVFIIDPSRGDTYVLDVTPEQTVKDLKMDVDALTGSEPGQTELELDGRVLKEEKGQCTYRQYADACQNNCFHLMRLPLIPDEVKPNG